MTTPSGLLIIDKPLHHTSMDVCAIVRGKLRRGGAPKRIKVGHAGTLDPLATGVLVVLIGTATRLSHAMMAGEKRYEGVVDLSATSATDDAEGPVTPVHVAAPPTRDAVEAALRRFVGEIDQVPPQVSAVHAGGRRAYEIARGGGHAPLLARRVVVHAIDLLAYEWPLVSIRVVCGKGTYIRGLARDLGGALGTGGMLASLRRTAVGVFDISRAVPLARLPDALTRGDLLPVPEGSPDTR